MKKTLTLSALFFIAFSGMICAENAEQMLDRIEKANREVRSVSCLFEQTRVLVTKNKVQLSGTLEYQAPDRMSMVYTKPEGDLFEISENRLVMRNGGKEKKFDLEKTPLMRRLSECLLKAMSGEIRQLAAENKAVCQVLDSGERYVVTYEAPEGTAIGYSRINFYYRKSDCLLVQLDLYEPSGMANLYLLKEISRSVKM